MFKNTDFHHFGALDEFGHKLIRGRTVAEMGFPRAAWPQMSKSPFRQMKSLPFEVGLRL